MNDPTPSRDLPPTADQLAEDAQYYRRVLHEIIDMGADLARALHQQGTAPASGEPGAERAADVTVAFDRVSRTVRRTILLARKVAEPAPVRAASFERQRLAARRQIIRKVEDRIQEKASEAEAGALHAELLDRLDSPDLDDDIASRPVGDIIWEICEDFGLTSGFGSGPCPRRTPEDVALVCERAAAQPGERIERRTAAPRARVGRDPVFRPRVSAPAARTDDAAGPDG